MESHDSLLLCNETLFPSTPSPSPVARRDATCYCIKPNSATIYNDEENGYVLQNYVNRERNYKPMDGYIKHLQLSSELCATRLRAVRWIILVISYHTTVENSSFQMFAYSAQHL